MYGNLGYGTGSSFGAGNCCCSLPMLVILILIVLQFNRGKCGRGYDSDGKVGNGILFIIALFFLSCCNPCRRVY
jgi:hypothetical protein